MTRASQAGGFENGVRNALTAILASPYFLYRAEGGDSSGTRTLTDIELASRLSFFLWGSIPDDELLAVAIRGELNKPAVLDAQVRRMLADPKAMSLSTRLRLPVAEPREDGRDRAGRAPVPQRRRHAGCAAAAGSASWSCSWTACCAATSPSTALLTADYTYLNEALATLYGIDSVKGGQFRRVALPDSKRYGLLGKGAVLMVTAYPNRTCARAARLVDPRAPARHAACTAAAQRRRS